MRSIWSKIKNETGQSIILVALMLVVLCGTAALVVDLGTAYVQKGQLQNAADAAALAAAHDLPNATTARNTAESYAMKNGIEAGHTTATTPYNGDPKKVEVVITETVNYTFARVIGFNSQELSARAVAQQVIAGGDAFDYAVFAGGGAASFNGSKHTFVGSVYGRDGVSLGNNATVTGNVICTISGSISQGNGSFISGSVNSNSSAIALPDFSDLIKAQGIVCNNQTQFDVAVNGKTVDGPIYVNGNVTINGRVRGTGIIYASGTITFLNDNILQTASDHILFYAATGDMTFNGGSGVCVGILYAPNGTIRVNGGPNSTTYGRIIAKNVDINGAKASVYSNAADLDSLSTLISYKLVE